MKEDRKREQKVLENLKKILTTKGSFWYAKTVDLFQKHRQQVENPNIDFPPIKEEELDIMERMIELVFAIENIPSGTSTMEEGEVVGDTFFGQVVKIEEKFSTFQGQKTSRTVMTVVDHRGFMLHGTAPKKLLSKQLEKHDFITLKSRQVHWKQQRGNHPIMGFFKRPSSTRLFVEWPYMTLWMRLWWLEGKIYKIARHAKDAPEKHRKMIQKLYINNPPTIRQD
jgi:hypothetical protein